MKVVHSTNSNKDQQAKHPMTSKFVLRAITGFIAKSRSAAIAKSNRNC